MPDLIPPSSSMLHACDAICRAVDAAAERARKAQSSPANTVIPAERTFHALYRIAASLRDAPGLALANTILLDAQAPPEARAQAQATLKAASDAIQAANAANDAHFEAAAAYKDASKRYTQALYLRSRVFSAASRVRLGHPRPRDLPSMARAARALGLVDVASVLTSALP